MLVVECHELQRRLGGNRAGRRVAAQPRTSRVGSVRARGCGSNLIYSSLCFRALHHRQPRPVRQSGLHATLIALSL